MEQGRGLYSHSSPAAGNDVSERERSDNSSAAVSRLVQDSILIRGWTQLEIG